MIAAALRAEADEYVSGLVEEVDEHGKRLVVRNGRARERRVTIGSGTVAIRAPRVNDKGVDEQTGERQKFSSKILPAYARRSPKVNDVLPVLYLRGLSTGDFRPASSSCSVRTPRACRHRRSAGCARSGRPSTSASAPVRCAFTATRTASLTASTSASVWARTFTANTSERGWRQLVLRPIVSTKAPTGAQHRSHGSRGTLPREPQNAPTGAAQGSHGQHRALSRAGFRGDRISWFPRSKERERDAPYCSSSESRTRRAGCRRATGVGGRC